MIKKYKEFINENFNSFGEEVESKYQDDYIKNIVNRYISTVDPDIRISNAINSLDEKTIREIKSQVDNYLTNGIEEKEVEVNTSVELTESVDVLENEVETSYSGKGVFKSFLKSLTAFGKNENQIRHDICPDDFLIYYQLDNNNKSDVASVFSRFRSLNLDFESVGDNVILYFGIRMDSYFEYGMSDGSNKKIIGKFKINKSTINWISGLNLKSAKSLKSILSNLDYKNIKTLYKIKSDIKKYEPGKYENKSPIYINDRVITFGYYGIGKWIDGKMDNDDYLNMKNNISEWINTKSWGDKVTFGVVAKSFWLKIYIKLK